MFWEEGPHGPTLPLSPLQLRNWKSSFPMWCHLDGITGGLRWLPLSLTMPSLWVPFRCADVGGTRMGLTKGWIRMNQPQEMSDGAKEEKSISPEISLSHHRIVSKAGKENFSFFLVCDRMFIEFWCVLWDDLGSRWNTLCLYEDQQTRKWYQCLVHWRTGIERGFFFFQRNVIHQIGNLTKWLEGLKGPLLVKHVSLGFKRGPELGCSCPKSRNCSWFSDSTALLAASFSCIDQLENS